MKRPNLEPILPLIAPNRRQLLKAAITGAAFAIPAIATFSMRGSFTNKAQAQTGDDLFPVVCSNQPYCSNQAALDICGFAQQVLLGISGLGFDTIDRVLCTSVSIGNRTKIYDRVVTAQSEVARAILEGSPHCNDKNAKQHYQSASNALDSYAALVSKLSFAGSNDLITRAMELHDELASLTNSQCS